MLQLTTIFSYEIVVEQVSGRDHVLNHLSIPAACFTHPEISMVGLTEVKTELLSTGYIIANMHFVSNAHDIE